MKTKRLLISIDTLFDTYLGTLHSINPTLAYKLASNPRYHNRESNKLSLLDSNIVDELIETAYKNRSNKVLRVSKATPLVALIMSHSKSKLESDHPMAIKLEITINMHPYALSKDENIELFSTLKKIWNVDKILMTNKSYKSLTPKHLKKFYDLFTIYDLNLWTGYHLNSLKLDKIPNITCLYPPTVFSGKEGEVSTINITTGISSGYSGYMIMEPLDVSDVSVNREFIT